MTHCATVQGFVDSERIHPMDQSAERQIYLLNHKGTMDGVETEEPTTWDNEWVMEELIVG